MQTHIYNIPSQEDQPHYRLLCSDLHLGSAYADHDRIREDFDMARRANARVLANGDVWDAISPGDKRFALGCTSPGLANSKDFGNALVDMAFRFFEPIADLVDVIGVGNHEETWVKLRAHDLTADLIVRLNAHLEKQKSSHRVRHGGISGFILTRFLMPAGTSGATVDHRLMYQHGAGGDSAITKGAVDSYKRGNSFEYDCLTFGHKHNNTFTRDVVTTCTKAGHIRDRERLSIQTASYLRNIVRTGQKRPLDYSYAEGGHHPSKPLGGSLLILTPARRPVRTTPSSKTRGSTWYVKQDFATSYIEPFAPPKPKATRKKEIFV